MSEVNTSEVNTGIYGGIMVYTVVIVITTNTGCIAAGVGRAFSRIGLSVL